MPMDLILSFFLPSREMDLAVGRIWELLALLLGPDAAESTDSVTETQLPVIDAVVVAVTPPLASPALVTGRVVVSGRTLVRLDVAGAGTKLETR